jgi:hypothetical protein
MSITDAAARLDIALSAWRSDPEPRNEPAHLDAALRATGELQRALILCRLSCDQPKSVRGAYIAPKNVKKKRGIKP